MATPRRDSVRCALPGTGEAYTGLKRTSASGWNLQSQDSEARCSPRLSVSIEHSWSRRVQPVGLRWACPGGGSGPCRSRGAFLSRSAVVIVGAHGRPRAPSTRHRQSSASSLRFRAAWPLLRSSAFLARTGADDSTCSFRPLGAATLASSSGLAAESSSTAPPMPWTPSPAMASARRPPVTVHCERRSRKQMPTPARTRSPFRQGRICLSIPGTGVRTQRPRATWTSPMTWP